jgi:toxin ParE1/3/4
VSRLRILPSAEQRIDNIYLDTAERWGAAQADRYLRGLYARLHAIAARDFPWRPLPAEFGANGYACSYESHRIYWRVLGNGDIGIVSVLHQRMNQIARFRDDFDEGA